MRRGCPTGAAMPLCWSHAEYVSLVRSRHDGVCFHRVDPAYRRYVTNPGPSRYEIWTLRHALRRISRDKILRIILAEEAAITWSTDNWQRTNESQMTHQNALNLWFADFPTTGWSVGSLFVFTLFWKRNQRWENRNWQVSVVDGR
jgi:glucoamylase